MQFPETYDFYGPTVFTDQSLKVLDEAAEFREAAKADPYGWETLMEAMDVYQALANYLVHAFTELEVRAAYEDVFAKNWNRNYYDVNRGGTLYEKAKQHAEEMGLDD